MKLLLIFSSLICLGSLSVLADISAGPLAISPESKDMIVHFETGGKAYYEKALSKPSWPGGASGVTIGIGYDVGYNTAGQIRSDWADLPANQLTALAGAAGVKGVAARPRAAALRWFSVPWSAAEKVFVRRTMPRFGSMTASAFPGILQTHPHIQGTMLSTVFNRGADLRGPRRREMAESAVAISKGEVGRLPALQRSMKRLWVGKGLDGLLRRYEAHARMIERAL